MRDRLRKIIVWFVVLLLVFGGSFGCVLYANHLLDTGAALAAVIALWVVGMIAFAVGIFIFVRKYKDLISVAARAKTDQPASEHVQKVNEEIGNAIEGKRKRRREKKTKVLSALSFCLSASCTAFSSLRSLFLFGLRVFGRIS